MTDNKTNCKEVMSHICDNLGEELNSPKCIEIKLHLENCPDCQHYFSSVDKTIQLYRKYNVSLSRESENKLLSFLGLHDQS